MADEIDEILATLGADVPAMDDHAFAAGRALLTAAITRARPEPAATVHPEPRVLELAPATRRRSPPLRRFAPLIGVAAAVTAVATGIAALLPNAGPASTTTPAAAPRPPASTPEPIPTGPLPAMPAAPLNSAGELAALVHDPVLARGEVRYWSQTYTVAASASTQARSQKIEVWQPFDRSYPWLTRVGDGQLEDLTPGAYRVQHGACQRDATGYLCPDLGPWAPTENNVAALPRDPAKLYAALRAGVNAGPPAGASIAVTPAQAAVNNLLGLINDAIVVPADLRAALLRTLGYLPGVTIDRDAHATDGRAVITIGWLLDGGNYRNELLLDPGTGRAVEWRNVAVRAFDGHQAGTTFVSYRQDEAVVHALGEEPAR